MMHQVFHPHAMFAPPRPSPSPNRLPHRLGILSALACSTLLPAMSTRAVSQGKEVSLVTGRPIGELSVAGRLSIDLHAEFMLSRSYGSERALNWFSCGYSGGGAGGTTVGGAFGHFGFQVPFEERETRYPLAVDTDGVPAVRFDGDDFLKSNIPIEASMTGSGTMAVELWFRTDPQAPASVVLGWQSVDGRESSAPLSLTPMPENAPRWHHLVVNCTGNTEVRWLDGVKGRSTARTLAPRPGHVMVLGGASSALPSFRGEIAAVRLHDGALTDDEITRNFKGGAMLGTELHDWWPDKPGRWWTRESTHFRHAVDEADMERWSADERAAFDKRLPEMFELAELCYHVYSERLAMRSSVVSVKPAERGDGIKYRIPIQATQGSWMGFDGRFGWACQGAGFINPHELVHGWQAMTGGMAGNYWEVHANFPQTYLGIHQTVPVIAMETPAFPASGRTYYHDRSFFEHLAQTPEYGPMFISKLWYDGPGPDAKDPSPWTSFERMNPYPDRTVGLEYTRAAMRNVTWDYRTFVEFKPGIGFADGTPAAEAAHPYRRVAGELAAGPQQALLRGRALLERIPHDPAWWRVPKEQSPQQFGYNICPLTFRPGRVTARLEGWVDARRGGRWHAGFVGVDADGKPVYSDVFRDGERGTFDAPPSLRELHLVVCATPTVMPDIPMTGDFRSFEQEPFPWKVSLEGCEPKDELLSTRGPAAGKAHPNGGGMVEATATVEASAWVGPEARVTGESKVLGMARIEDHAVVHDSTVRDAAVVSGHALVMGRSTVSGNAKVRDFAVVKDASTVTGNARVLEHAVLASGKTCGGHVTVKGIASVYGGNQRGTALIDGWYAKANDIDKGKWFTWSWGQGKNPGEVDEDFAGLYADFTFDQSHGWMARDDHGATWGVLVNQPAFVQRRDPAATKNDRALALDGKSNFVELQPDLADLRQATYTACFNWNGNSPDAKVFAFAGADGSELSLSPSLNGKMVFRIRADGGTAELSAPAPRAGTWVEVRVVLDAPDALLQVNRTTVATSRTMTLRPDAVSADRGYLGRGADGGWFGGMIGRFTVHKIPLVDKVPPMPDPAAFELAPSFVAPHTLLMIAAPGEDPLGSVEYWFEEQGGRWNSGWTKERIVRLDGRDASRPLHYRVRMRDLNGNEGAWSKPALSGGHPPGTTVHRVGDDPPAVIEAEHPMRAVASADGTSVWQLASEPAGFTGEGFMAVPDRGRVNDPFRPDAARLDYALHFAGTGRHFLWVRASGNNDGGQSIHAGLGLDPGAWGLKARTGFGRFTWTRLPPLEVTAAGDHVLSLWMHEDGAMIDRLLLTRDPDYEPSPKDADGTMTGTGPPATPPMPRR
jgi:Family of unknown function (DUF6055)/Concanavalin A-like lectin/glucanases superfamily